MNHEDEGGRRVAYARGSRNSCKAYRHGYAIMRDVSNDTNGALRLGPGTLYGCLNRVCSLRVWSRSPTSDQILNPKLS